MKPYMHAWFSQQAADRYGSWGMRLISGKEVRITCVDDNFSNDAEYYLWPDKVYLGLVDSNTYHDYWRGDEEQVEYIYCYDSYGEAYAQPYIRGAWTKKYHSIESRRWQLATLIKFCLG